RSGSACVQSGVRPAGTGDGFGVCAVPLGKDNCGRFVRLVLQIPQDRFRCHYVNAKVRVHRYPDGSLAVFHGPRLLADALGRCPEPAKQDAA
ncbi:MAG: hypothetical protein ACRERU_09230, partial [Methylococcales bacterium]